MIENIIVGVIVTAAFAFLTRKLWSKNSGCSKGGCGCSSAVKIKSTKEKSCE